MIPPTSRAIAPNTSSSNWRMNTPLVLAASMRLANLSAVSTRLPGATARTRSARRSAEISPVPMTRTSVRSDVWMESAAV
jgi:hypothetical protein